MLSAVPAVEAFDYWNHIRYSALLPDTTVTIRMENPSGTGIENYLIYLNGSLSESLMIPVPYGPSTLEGNVRGSQDDTLFYGFRFVDPDWVYIMPVKIAEGVSPEPGELTSVAEDPVGDEIYGFANLDITECRFSFSDDRLYATIKNAGGGFPLNYGLTFFGYLVGINNPAQADPDTVWGMMYTYEVAGIVSSGLFRIEGPATSDLIKLGEIEVQEFPSTNELRISCLLSDLMADPYFSAWYDTADPAMDVAAFTQRITILGGASEADRSAGADCYLREFSMAPVANQLPVLSNAEFIGSGQGAFAQIEYTDADANCPVISEIVFDGTQSFEMYPQSLDYGAMVVYSSDSGLAPLAGDSWDTAVFRFSDDQENIVEYEVVATGAESIPPAAHVSVAPNPFNASTTISLTLPAEAHVRVSAYDAVGERVAMILDDILPAGTNDIYWNGRNAAGRDVGSGVYFLAIKADSYKLVRKMVLLR
jgi:hypothetical protein